MTACKTCCVVIAVVDKRRGGSGKSDMVSALISLMSATLTPCPGLVLRRVHHLCWRHNGGLGCGHRPVKRTVAGRGDRNVGYVIMEEARMKHIGCRWFVFVPAPRFVVENVAVAMIAATTMPLITADKVLVRLNDDLHHRSFSINDGILGVDPHFPFLCYCRGLQHCVSLLDIVGTFTWVDGAVFFGNSEMLICV